jgi:TetR/AcrR family transcriptional repressor of nem operon
MRKSRVEAAETRQRIIDVAARKFRLDGIHATGLTDVMADAGLTHGGFYRHFESKDRLVAQACASAMTAIVATLEDSAAEKDGKDGFRAVVERYVSASHRDDPDGGCPVAAMGSELARGDENTRVAASECIDELIEVVAKRVGHGRSEAVFAVAAMIGAITMSRIMLDDASTQVLQYVKQHLDAI